MLKKQMYGIALPERRVSSPDAAGTSAMPDVCTNTGSSCVREVTCVSGYHVSDRAPCKSIGNEKVTNKFISSSILLQLDYGSKN